MKIIDLQHFGTWKLQLTVSFNFIPSNQAGEGRVMHSRSNKVKFKCYIDVNDVVAKHFDSICPRY